MADNVQNPAPAADQPAGGTQQPVVAPAGIDYDKLAQALDRGLAQKERSILGSFIKEAGLSDDEAKEAIAAFQAQKAQKAQKDVDLQKENDALKAQILQGKVDAEISKLATELGIAAANVPHVTKLADLTGATTDKGEVDAKAIKAALEKVLTDVPAFKVAESEKPKGIKVGSKAPAGDAPDEATRKLRAAFGLK